MLHRYLLFTYADAEAEGGWQDFHSSHVSIEDALQALRRDPPVCDNEYHLVDMVTGDIVAIGSLEAIRPA